MYTRVTGVCTRSKYASAALHQRPLCCLFLLFFFFYPSIWLWLLYNNSIYLYTVQRQAERKIEREVSLRQKYRCEYLSSRCYLQFKSSRSQSVFATPVHHSISPLFLWSIVSITTCACGRYQSYAFSKHCSIWSRQKEAVTWGWYFQHPSPNLLPSLSIGHYTFTILLELAQRSKQRYRFSGVSRSKSVDQRDLKTTKVSARTSPRSKRCKLWR